MGEPKNDVTASATCKPSTNSNASSSNDAHEQFKNTSTTNDDLIDCKATSAIYANIRGLHPKTNQTKISYLADLAKICNAPFISLTETHLNSEILDAEINIANYTPYRCDRTGRSHGGVCTYVRNDFVTTIILKDSNSYCDTLVLKIHQMDLIIINFYRPPKCPSHLFLQSLHKIKQAISDFEDHTKKSHDIIVTTDCNFPDIQWVQKTGYYKINQSKSTSGEESIQIKDFLNFADEFFLYQIVDIPTRVNNTPDWSSDKPLNKI